MQETKCEKIKEFVNQHCQCKRHVFKLQSFSKFFFLLKLFSFLMCVFKFKVLCGKHITGGQQKIKQITWTGMEMSWLNWFWNIIYKNLFTKNYVIWHYSLKVDIIVRSASLISHFVRMSVCVSFFFNQWVVEPQYNFNFE